MRGYARSYFLTILFILSIKSAGASYYVPDPFERIQYHMNVLDKSGVSLFQHSLDRIQSPDDPSIVYFYGDENRILLEIELNKLETIDIDKSKDTLNVLESQKVPDPYEDSNLYYRLILGYRNDLLYLKNDVNDDNITIIETFNLKTGERNYITYDIETDLDLLKNYDSDGNKYHKNSSIGEQDWIYREIKIQPEGTTYNYPYITKALRFFNKTESYINGSLNIVQNVDDVFVRYNLETRDSVALIIQKDGFLRPAHTSSDGVYLAIVSYNSTYPGDMIRYYWENGEVIDKTSLEYKGSKIVPHDDYLWMFPLWEELNAIQVFDLMTGNYSSIIPPNTMMFDSVIVTDDYIVDIYAVQIFGVSYVVIGLNGIMVLVVVIRKKRINNKKYQ